MWYQTKPTPRSELPTMPHATEVKPMAQIETITSPNSLDTSSETVLSALGTRHFVFFQNGDGTETIVLSNNGADASASNYCLKLGPGDGMPITDPESAAAEWRAASLSGTPDLVLWATYR